jgi:two-component system, cell cycle response regulator
VEKARALHSLHSEAKACNALAFVLAKQGHFGNAEHHFERAYELFKQIGKYFSVASVRQNQAVDRLLRGEPEAVISLATEALNIFARLAHPYGVATSHQVMAEAYLMTGDVDQAQFHASQAMNSEETVVIPDALRVLGEVQHQRGDLPKAVQIIQQAVEAAKENSDKYLEAYAWRSLAAVYIDERQVHSAQIAISKAMDLFADMNLSHEVARCQDVQKEIDRISDG